MSENVSGDLMGLKMVELWEILLVYWMVENLVEYSVGLMENPTVVLKAPKMVANLVGNSAILLVGY